MEYLTRFLAELLLIFEDFKFWLKRRKQRKFEGKQGIPKTTLLYPSQKIFIVVLVLVPALFVIRGTFFLYENAEKQNAKKLSEVASLLKHEKEHQDIIQSNWKPLSEIIPYFKICTRIIGVDSFFMNDISLGIVMFYFLLERMGN